MSSNSGVSDGSKLGRSEVERLLLLSSPSPSTTNPPFTARSRPRRTKQQSSSQDTSISVRNTSNNDKSSARRPQRSKNSANARPTTPSVSQARASTRSQINNACGRDIIVGFARGNVKAKRLARAPDSATRTPLIDASAFVNLKQECDKSNSSSNADAHSSARLASPSSEESNSGREVDSVLCEGSLSGSTEQPYQVDKTSTQTHSTMDNVATTSMPTADDKARYEAARKALIQSLQRKREVDRQLAQLEVQIYNFEGSYLSETAQHSGGNIIQGFDGYLKTQNVGRRRHEITDSDRVFSNSSMTYQKSLELLGDNDDQSGAGDNLDGNDRGGSSSTHVNGPGRDRDSNLSSRGPTPGLTTVMLPPPTQRTQQELTAAQQKKARDKEYQRRKRANAAREKSLAAAAAAAVAVANASGNTSSGADGSSGEKSGMGPSTVSGASEARAGAANSTSTSGAFDEAGAGNDDNETISTSKRHSKRSRVADYD